MSDYNLDKISNLLRKCSWRWAKTYYSIPHEYIVRDKCALSDEEFLYIVRAQRELGKREVWGKYNFPYLYVDGYKYWTMGDTLPNTVIINRQKVFNEFDTLEIPNPKYYSQSTMKIIANILQQIGSTRYYEVGCGDGEMLKEHIQVSPSDYKCVEPSVKLVNLFKANNPKFSRSILNKSFEESMDRWREFEDCLLIALFGSASYIMPSYLEMIPTTRKKYLLMFYRDEYVPEELSIMHHFKHSERYLVDIFRGAFICKIKNYIIVTSEKINVKKAIEDYEFYKSSKLFESV